MLNNALMIVAMRQRRYHTYMQMHGKKQLLPDVPFVANPDDRCVPATIAMVLAYFLPARRYTLADAERLSGYEKGRGTWQTLSMLNLAELGFELRWVEDFDHARFAADPEAYLRTILDPEALDWQLHHTNLKLEATRMREYLARGLPVEQRAGTNDDVRRFLDDGWLVRIEVNSRPLSARDGYIGHSVLAIGYDETGVVLHNPDGENGNRPAQHVPWELFDRAWREFGGSFSLYAFRKKRPAPLRGK